MSCFISLEGAEGVGKTTCADFVKRYLESHGVSEVILTHEPGGTPLAEKIRDLLLDPDGESVSDATELLLMFASRAQHVAHKIKPALARGQWVVCSRFSDSSRAYQGYGRGHSLTVIDQLAQLAHPQLEPDLTLLFDLPVEVGLERARSRGQLDRIEQEQQQFFERVRQGYLVMAQQHQRFKIIDASGSLKDVQMGIERVLESFIKVHQVT